MVEGIDGSRWDGLGRDELVEELIRANRRLSGTLAIVLDTLDSTDVETLFDRVLEELSATLDATGAIMYLVGSDGYHLRGVSHGVDASRVPGYVSLGRMIDVLGRRAGQTLRLRVLPPTGDELRAGPLTRRTVLDEDTLERYLVDAATLPPFTSLLAAPVWFGRQVVALIEVGWAGQYPTRHEDAELLDAVTRYLSVQLVGAFSAMRQRREAELRDARTRLREWLLSRERIGAGEVVAVLGQVAAELDAACVPLERGAGGRDMVADFAGKRRTLPEGLGVLPGREDGEGGAVVAVDERTRLGSWLAEVGEPCVGALVDVGPLDGIRPAVLLLRQQGAEPLDSVELAFVRHVIEGIRSAREGEEARSRDKRISQALQLGMRNELRAVAGITAQGVYSSATEAASVGGDFYDLTALPERRACVIMGDVSGKGVEAASVSAAVRTALSAYAWEGLSPARMVGLLNDFLLGFSRLETFATLFVGVIDLAEATITYCSAGHPPALLRRAETGELVPLDVQSGMVGAFREMAYRDGVATIAPGDLLVLYTDGTTEARSPDGAFFGEDGLREALIGEVAAETDGLCERLLADIDAFTGRSLGDDVAIVTLRFDEVG